MKAIRMYQCEVCGNIYDTLEEEQACEGSHHKPLQVIHNSFHSFSLYPDYITLKMDDGKLIEYHYKGEAE